MAAGINVDWLPGYDKPSLNTWYRHKRLDDWYKINQQKVCVSRAITYNPELLFVNEPTRGIDIYSKELILDWLLKMNEDNNTTVVITSGELEELIRTCDRIVVMYQGKIFRIFEENLDIEEITLSLYGRDAHEV